MKDDDIARFHKTAKFYPYAVFHKNSTKVTKNDLDILAEATIENCGIMLPMTEHDKNAELDLTNLIVHAKIVDNCFDTTRPRSVTGIMVGLPIWKMSPEALDENCYHHFKLLSMRDLIQKITQKQSEIYN